MKRLLGITLASGLLLLAACVVPSAPSQTPASVLPATQPPPLTTQPSMPPQPIVSESERYVYENGALIVGGDEEPIELRDNPSAANPTYAELVAFITLDATDKNNYVDRVEAYLGEVPYVCGDFAEDVHNNAEAAGIRAAWVSILFEGSDEGHALNVFETTDRGLVYIDCTGDRNGGILSYLHAVETDEGSSFVSDSPTSWDSIAYVEVGKEYGLIPLANAASLLYSFYEDYKQKWQEREELVEEFNAEVAEYNEEISGKTYITGSPELAAIKAWEASLREKEEAINELEAELGDYQIEPMGIVKEVHIHW